MGKKATVTVDAEDFQALAQRCRDLLLSAVRPDVQEQLLQWVEDFEDDAEAMEGRRSRYAAEAGTAEP